MASQIFTAGGSTAISLSTGGVATFTSLPECSAPVTSNNQLTNKTYVDTIIGILYPIGIIISTSTSTNPGTYITGTTWVAYAAGQTLVGKAAAGTFAVAGSTGGAETVTLTANNLPAHTHANTLSQSNHSHTIQRTNIACASYGADASPYYFPAANTGTTLVQSQGADANITLTNGNNTTTNTAINNLQPYIVVYYWTRTA